MVATSEIVWVQPDGTRRTLVLGVGVPYEEKGCWRCPVTLDGLHTRLVPAAGVDSLQALCLAIALVHSRLRHLVEDGGRLLIPGTEGEFPLDAYFRAWSEPRTEGA